MEYGELYIEPERRNYNPQNGRFLKGHTPHNKGKRWSEYMTKSAQRKAAKGWINLDKYRPKKRAANAGRRPDAVVAVTDGGRWVVIPNIREAARWSNSNRENIRRCCMLNYKRHVNQKTGKVNTDHRYNGIRYYYEKDDIWTTKICQSDY